MTIQIRETYFDREGYRSRPAANNTNAQVLRVSTYVLDFPWRAGAFLFRFSAHPVAAFTPWVEERIVSVNQTNTKKDHVIQSQVGGKPLLFLFILVWARGS